MKRLKELMKFANFLSKRIEETYTKEGGVSSRTLTLKFIAYLVIYIMAEHNVGTFV